MSRFFLSLHVHSQTLACVGILKRSEDVTRFWFSWHMMSLGRVERQKSYDLLRIFSGVSDKASTSVACVAQGITAFARYASMLRIAFFLLCSWIGAGGG